MKNSLSLTTGPATVNPNWLRRKGFFGPGTFQGLAVMASLRRNSKRLPWNSFDPDLVVALTCDVALPYSAE
jgi:hypothetical protein